MNKEREQLAKYIKKIEKKAADRKSCIKKLYVLLEEKERELETIKKSPED